LALVIPEVAQPRPIRLQPGEIFVRGIVLHRDHHRCWVGESSQIVHVAMGVVAGDSIPEPQNVSNAQGLTECLLQQLPG